MKKRHKGLKVLAVVLTLFLAFPCSIVSAAAKPNIKIKHDSPKDYVPGFRIFLDTEIKEKADVLVARCYFKTKKDKNLVFVDMVPKGNPGYQATLPAPWLGSEYIEYAFVVVNKDKGVIRTQMFKMKERETTAATSWKEATEVKEIPLDKAQEAVERYEAVKKDLVREYKDRLPKHQKAEAQEILNVLTEFDKPLGQLQGFYDNMVVSTVPVTQKYGVLAEGLYTPTEIAAIGGTNAITASTGAVTAGTVTATGAIGIGTIAIAALVAGGAAAAAGGGGGGGGGGSSTSTTTTPSGQLASFTAPNAGGQQVPLGIEIIAHDGISVPMSVTYDGAPLADYVGTGTVFYDLNGIFTVGGVMRLTLTADVAAPGAGREFHFTTNGGRRPAPFTPFQIIGQAGSYILLTTR